MKPGKGSVFVKGEALIPNVSKEIVLTAITDPKFRTIW